MGDYEGDYGEDEAGQDQGDEVVVAGVPVRQVPVVFEHQGAHRNH